MENATKALIIAGAILVSILLVTMGITLLNGANGLTSSNKSTMSELEVRQFNGRLAGGIGSNVTGSDLESMLETIEAMKREDPELDMTVTLNGTDITADIAGGIKTIKRTARYTVEDGKNQETGLINSITITKK